MASARRPATRVLLSSSAAMLIACATHQTTPTADAPRTVLRTARLFDPGNAAISRDVVVIVEGQRIAGVLPFHAYHPRGRDQLTDLGDVTLLPGLIDAHVHLTIGTKQRQSALADVHAGFTTVADLGAVSSGVLRFRDSVNAGLVEGPRILAAGQWIGAKNGVCEFGGIGVVGGADAYRARVRENIAAGANVIKACVSGWASTAWSYPDSSELSPAILEAIVDEAHRAHRLVVAHALSRASVRLALDAGVDGLVHTAFIDDSLAMRMRKQGLWMIPTLASLMAGDTSTSARHLPDAVRVAYRNGVTLVFGTDGGVLPHGQNAQEASALLAVGVSAADVLRAATINAARALGLADSVGVVRAGMIADLVAVPGDPLLDVKVLEHPRFVMTRGRLVVLSQ